VAAVDAESVGDVANVSGVTLTVGCLMWVVVL